MCLGFWLVFFFFFVFCEGGRPSRDFRRGSGVLRVCWVLLISDVVFLDFSGGNFMLTCVEWFVGCFLYLILLLARV